MTDSTPPEDPLIAPAPAEIEELSHRLHDRLVAAAEREGILDISYRVVDSPVGRLLIAATNRGLMRLAFDAEGHDAVLGMLAERVSPRILRAGARLDDVAVQLDGYFAGTLTRFELPLDLRLAQGFRRRVLEALPHIAYGATASYAAVALDAGSPKAVRAVGTACATNPLPVVIPCHRVVRSDGTIGQYVGGGLAKRTLLSLEGASVA